jgi:glycosyltransferase involved in cell wall biosynthesis
MNMPLVTVLMPVYNGEKFLAEAIESVISQTYPNIEFLIIDDGSTDGTAAILRRYQAQDRRINLLCQSNQGLVASLNRGLAAARGIYLARMDADDVSSPSRFQQQVDFLEKHPKNILLGSAYELIDEHGSSIRVDRHPSNDTEIRWQMLFHNGFAHSAVMLNTNSLRQNHLMYDPEMEQAEDYELWSGLIQYGRCGNLDQPLVKRRIGGMQKSIMAGDQVSFYADRISCMNIRHLGVEVDTASVAQMKAWYYRLPGRLEKQQLPLLVLLLQILNSFSCQTGLDHGVVRLIRGRWLIKVLALRSSGRSQPLWKLGLLSCFRAGDFLAALDYVWRRRVHNRRIPENE